MQAPSNSSALDSPKIPPSPAHLTAPKPTSLALHAECQISHAVGASVYDSTHNQSRGYGEIQAAAPPAENGMPRWKVVFTGGQRNTCIQQDYLDLSLIHHSHRQAPSGLQQRVAVMVGNHKGRKGTTVKKVGGGRVQAGCRRAA